MIREFDEEELEQAAKGRDTELTLGAGMLLALGLGLVLLCVVCFGFGYAVGHHVAPVASVGAAQAVTQSPIQPVSSTAKPAARTTAPPAPATDPTSASVSNIAAIQTSKTAPEAGGKKTVALNTDGPSSQSQVKPALAGQGASVQSGQSSSSLHVQPALSQIQGWMVQIAAVSHPEDAEVLVNALKRRGYAVTVRRDVADNLLHVQTGPFTNRNDADGMRQKLLNDGYNAIVQP
jgi:DedD protein